MKIKMKGGGFKGFTGRKTHIYESGECEFQQNNNDIKEQLL
jgi:hypothetical protein